MKTPLFVYKERFNIIRYQILMTKSRTPKTRCMSPVSIPINVQGCTVLHRTDGGGHNRFRITSYFNGFSCIRRLVTH